MKHLTITCLLVSAALLGGAAHSNACTSIIVSGKVTPDGRPYIFKNRDTHDLDNQAIQIQGPRYRFIGIVATKSHFSFSPYLCSRNFCHCEIVY